jgi:hypothetical protein
MRANVGVQTSRDGHISLERSSALPRAAQGAAANIRLDGWR